MNRLLLLIIGIVLGVVAMQGIERGMFNGLVPHATRPTDDDDDDAAARLERVAETVRVILTPAEVSLAGIEASALQPARATPEFTTTGRVVNVAELLALLGELRAAHATAAAGRAVVAPLAARVARLRRLDATGEITIARELAALEVEYQRELATSAAREAHVAQLAAALRARWGTAVAALAQQPDGPLARVERGEALLVEFVADGEPPGSVQIAASDVRTDAVTAAVLGPGTTTVGGARGTGWFAIVPGAGLRSGMPVSVWIPRTGSAVDGVVLPATAVVWHHGGQWYYVADDATHFSRHALGAALPFGRDYLLPAAAAPQGSVVVRGAQLLLAEEFRAAIPEEDDD